MLKLPTMINYIKCPTCNKELEIDSAGSFIWHCSTCKYGWSNAEIKAYWKGFIKGQNNNEGIKNGIVKIKENYDD